MSDASEPPARGGDGDVAAYAVVAHGLLTSASVIVGLSETLGARWDDLDDDRRRSLVAMMGEQARTIHTVLQSLVSALPPELFEPLREAIRTQIGAAADELGLPGQPVDLATAERSEPGTEASPNTSSD